MPSKLIVPALRAKMGDWIYYSAVMRFEDVAARVRPASEFHRSKALRHLVQRELTDRSKEIGKYLLDHTDRFFNSLVIAVAGGEPEWHGIDLRSTPRFDLGDAAEDVNDTMGVLLLNGEERMYALDGQHRVAGIQHALAKRKKLRDEEVSVLFVAHRESEAGLQRSRRLFTTLNRYAKPVAPAEIVALDEDNVIAIVTRSLMEEYPLFAEAKVSLSQQGTSLTKGKSIPRGDRSAFTTIVALHDVLDIVLKDRDDWRDFKLRRPSDELIAMYRDRAIRYWDAVARQFRPVREVRDTPADQHRAQVYRTRDGGHLLFRPIGQLILARVVRRWQHSGVKLATALRRVGFVPMDLNDEPWLGLLWDGSRMLTPTPNQRAAEQLLYYGSGGMLDDEELENLRELLAELTNQEPAEIEIRRYYNP